MFEVAKQLGNLCVAIGAAMMAAPFVAIFGGVAYVVISAVF